MPALTGILTFITLDEQETPLFETSSKRVCGFGFDL